MTKATSYAAITLAIFFSACAAGLSAESTNAQKTTPLAADQPSALAARIAIVQSYRDRDWWSPALCERYTAVLHWLTFRDLMRARDPSGAWPVLAKALSTPTRALAVATVVTRHATMRVRKRSLTTGRADQVSA